MSFHKSMAVTGLFAVLCATAICAQAQGTTTPRVGPVVPPKSVVTPTTTYVPVKPVTPVVTVIAIVPDMTGWTQISPRATLGGATLFSINGKTFVITTASDHALYMAPIDPAAPALIPSAAWETMSGTESTFSEPHCMTAKAGGDALENYKLLCLVLGAGGNAILASYDHTDQFHYLGWTNLGGHEAGGAPEFMGPARAMGNLPSQQPYYKLQFSFPVGVWGGANGQLFADRIVTGDLVTPGLPGTKWVTAQPAWPVQRNGYMGVPGCAVSDGYGAFCALVNADGTVSDFDVPVSDDAVVIAPAANVSPVLPGGLSGEIAAVMTHGGRLDIVARGKNGQLYQTYISRVGTKPAFAGWTSEGGSVKAGTQPSCIARNEQAFCIIQGADGKLYAKSLSPAGAM